MTAAARTHNLRPRHTERPISVSFHCARYTVEVRRPTTAGLEFVSRLVQRGIAGRAGIYAFLRRMLVVFASEWCFGALFSQDTELLCHVSVQDRETVTPLGGVDLYTF